MKKLLVFVSLVALSIFCYVNYTQASLSTSSPAVVATAPAATDWFPPNPYCGKTAADIAFPTPPACPAGEEIILNGQCARQCRDNYVAGILAAYELCCSRYGELVSMFQTIMDHYAMMAQQCIADCSGDPDCIDFCWAANQNVSATLFAEYEQKISAVNTAFQILSGIHKDAYMACLRNCCEPVIREPKPIR